MREKAAACDQCDHRGLRARTQFRVQFISHSDSTASDPLSHSAWLFRNSGKGCIRLSALLACLLPNLHSPHGAVVAHYTLTRPCNKFHDCYDPTNTFMLQSVCIKNLWVNNKPITFLESYEIPSKPSIDLEELQVAEGRRNLTLLCCRLFSQTKMSR